MDGVIIENPIKIHDLGVPLFLETSTSSSEIFGSFAHEHPCMVYRPAFVMSQRVFPEHLIAQTQPDVCSVFIFHRNWVVTPTCNPKPIFGDLANS